MSTCPGGIMTAKSDMPFSLGCWVCERVGSGRHAAQRLVRIDDVDGDTCRVSSGRSYRRDTGRRVPENEAGYRAIHSLGYQGALKPPEGL